MWRGPYICICGQDYETKVSLCTCGATGEAIHKFDRRAISDEIVEEMARALEKSKRYHHYCDDSYYSCPMHPEELKEHPLKNECNCGADKANAIIDAALSRYRAERGKK